MVLHQNIPCDAGRFLSAIGPFREDMVVGVECIFTWYWIADLCARERIAFVLGHALYMRAIHGAKAKNDRIDSRKTAGLLRGGLMPQAYVYPAEMRATRDLMRRRLHFEDVSVRDSLAADLALVDHYEVAIGGLETAVLRQARGHDPNSFELLRSTPGIGKILALTILYEIHDIHRFERVQDFASSPREVSEKLGREGPRHQRRQDRQCLPEVGVLRGRRAVAGKVPSGEGAACPHRAKARQGEGALDPRPQDRTSRLLHAGSQESLRLGALLEVVKGERGEPDI